MFAMFLASVEIFLLFVFFMLLSLVSNGQTTLFQFNFEGNSANPNVNNTVGTVIGDVSGVDNLGFQNNTNSCGTGNSNALRGNNWQTNDFYVVSVNTTGFANMIFSFCNSTNDNQIRNFDIRYSRNGGSTIIPISTTFSPITTGGTNSAVLPSAADNSSNILIYIYKTDNAGAATNFLIIDNVTLNGHRIPTISSFTPNSSCAASGTSVVITGSNFTGATAVKFNGVDAVFTVNSNTQITAQLPVTATTGAITVTTPGGTATSSTNISVMPPQGDQVIYGTGSWIGYVYANTNGGNPPTNAFSTTYRGYVTQTESFDLNLIDGSLSGPNLCGSYADNFAVRFKMNRNLPAGCYTFTVGGDDGYRLSLDGGLTYVVNNWGAHSYVETTYTVYLSGNTNFVLEYFENVGQSRVRFSSVFSSLVTPTVGTVNQPNCVVTTGNVPLSGLPASGTWTIIASPNTTGLTGLTGTGGTTTVGGLVAGTTYTFAVSNTTCTSPVTSNVVVDNVVTTTFNGSTWTSVPTISKIGIIAAPSASPITISSNTELCSCTVNTNSKIIVNQNVTLKLQDKLTINGSGTLTFQNNASLIQINNIGNSGNIIYERETAPIKRYDYTYWSSPVSNQKLIDVSPNTDYDKFYSFNATIDNWKQENPQDFMQRGIGYIIRAPENISSPPAPLGVYQANFVGVPFNGPLAITGISQDRSYLLGNPYPSALSADRFLNANSSVLDGTLYFWTHNTAIGIGVSNPGSGVYAYSSDDYATYNLTGGVGTGTGNSINNAEQTINKPTGKIAAGQAFFTSSKLSPTGTVIDFNNSMRLDVNGAILNNDQFFKVKNATKKTNTLERNRVWLNLTNTQGAFKQMLVGYVTNATDGFDSSFDGPSYNGNDFIDFYSISDDVAMTIQGRILPFDENDSVPLGYSSVIEGVFSISIDEVDGVFASQNIYLEDKFNNSIHDLKKAAYSFETATGTFDDRFVLRYTDKKLGVGDFVTTVTEVLVSVKNKRIKINSSVQSIDKVFIYDMLGKKLYEKINVENKELVIPNLGSSEQFLIVKTVLQNGIVVTTKTIY